MVDWHDPNEKKQTYKFPGVAADLLSTPSQRVIDFFSLRKENESTNHLTPLLEFFHDAQKTGQARFQHTRSGYVCRILNTLILHRSGAFATYMLNLNSHSALIEACHCKSTSVTLLNLITLLSSSTQTPMMMAAPASLLERQNELAVSTVAPDAVQDTLVLRKALFKEVLLQAIASADSAANSDLHANLVWIVSQLLIKQSAERAEFVKIFNELLPEIVEEFNRVFATSVSNRLGNLFLVALETQAKDAQSNNSQNNGFNQVVFCLPGLPDLLFRMIKVLVDTMEGGKPAVQEANITQTFSSEIKLSNSKLFKVLEALNVSLRLYHSDTSFVKTVICDSGLHRHIFALLVGSPFNNVLHNLVRRYLLLIIERTPNDVVDLYFAKNDEFIRFIDQLAGSAFMTSSTKRKIRKGYIGQAISICAALRERDTPENSIMWNSELISSKLAELFDQIFQQRV